MSLRPNAKTDSLTLRSDRLSVDVALPGGSAYRGSRFDWTGIVTQVTLDGRHTFCGREDPGGTGGVGLCNEFDIDGPDGFDEAVPGQPFAKLGVGLLTKPDSEPYRFDREYHIRPCATRLASGRDADGSSFVEFITDPIGCRGMATGITKRLTVFGNTLRIDYVLMNTGGRPLRTREYNHNFLAFNRQPVGRALLIDVPCDLHDAQAWLRDPINAFYSGTLEPRGTAHTWSIIDTAAGVTVSERTTLPWAAFALFGTPRVLCPEAFVDVLVPPGGEARWSRLYTFGLLDELR